MFGGRSRIAVMPLDRAALPGLPSSGSHVPQREPLRDRPRELQHDAGPAVWAAPSEEMSSVNWCAHRVDYIPVPRGDGGCQLISILGEAT